MNELIELLKKSFENNLDYFSSKSINDNVTEYFKNENFTVLGQKFDFSGISSLSRLNIFKLTDVDFITVSRVEVRNSVSLTQEFITEDVICGATFNFKQFKKVPLYKKLSRFKNSKLSDDIRCYLRSNSLLCKHQSDLKTFDDFQNLLRPYSHHKRNIQQYDIYTTQRPFYVIQFYKAFKVLTVDEYENLESEFFEKITKEKLSNLLKQ